MGSFMKTIAFLEWVRGLAAAMVVLAHVLAVQWPDFHYFTRNCLDLGRVGVVAFFLVSGYVISLSLRKQSIRTFMIRRTLRLHPIYIVALSAHLLATFGGSDWGNPR
jgi:peptidoglycan/LPS O-acetylase OafA/YrhL